MPTLRQKESEGRGTLSCKKVEISKIRLRHPPKRRFKARTDSWQEPIHTRPGEKLAAKDHSGKLTGACSRCER